MIEGPYSAICERQLTFTENISSAQGRADDLLCAGRVPVLARPDFRLGRNLIRDLRLRHYVCSLHGAKGTGDVTAVAIFVGSGVRILKTYAPPRRIVGQPGL